MSDPPIELPENFSWDDPETWPVEFRQLFEYTAQMAYYGLSLLDKKMLDCQIENADEPVTMIFAIGERADELRQAWRSVHALHNPKPPKEPA